MCFVDILIPTYNRPAGLAVTLCGLLGQTFKSFRIIISDQSDSLQPDQAASAESVCRALEARGHDVVWRRHLPRKGMAEQREYLLNQAQGPYALYLDDDLILEPQVLERLFRSIEEEGCGFVGSSVIGLSYARDFRPDEQQIELWRTRVKPEAIQPGSKEWTRHKLHHAANLLHVQERLISDRCDCIKYKVAWIGGCVLYDSGKLRQTGGFNFWRDLPKDHCGEDVLAQLRVMAKFGGCGVLRSGVYHQELPTTVMDRGENAPEILSIIPDRPC